MDGLGGRETTGQVSSCNNVMVVDGTNCILMVPNCMPMKKIHPVQSDYILNMVQLAREQVYSTHWPKRVLRKIFCEVTCT